MGLSGTARHPPVMLPTAPLIAAYYRYGSYPLMAFVQACRFVSFGVPGVLAFSLFLPVFLSGLALRIPIEFSSLSLLFLLRYDSDYHPLPPLPNGFY